METESVKLNKKNYFNLIKSRYEINGVIKNSKNKYICFIICFHILAFLLINLHIYYNKKQTDKKILDYFIKLNSKINELGIEYIRNSSDISRQYSNAIIPYIKEQNDFCDYPDIFYNKEIEKKIKLETIKLNGLTYSMYVYKEINFMSKEFMVTNSFEPKESINILNALQYYANKKNITNNKDIYMLDLGANIGWFPSFLGRYGYTILSFEPLEINYYVARKNFCYLNRNSNVIIITKGINDKEMVCDYYSQNENMGNGMVICNKSNIRNEKLNQLFKKSGIVKLTRLSNYIPFLSHKNLVLIKIDIEGAEEKAVLGGIELITIYHVPFIIIEFSPTYLEEHDSNPRKFIELFIENGYKISLDGFLSNKFISLDELMEKVGNQKNCYFIHEDIIDKGFREFNSNRIIR